LPACEHFIRWLIERHPVSEFLPHMAAAFLASLYRVQICIDYQTSAGHEKPAENPAEIGQKVVKKGAALASSTNNIAK
jgi:hypothetical protein